MIGTVGPKFIERVLDAIAKLAERKGSAAKDILAYVLKNSREINRNLAVKVRHALKMAVIEGLLKLHAGRYQLCRKPPAKKKKQKTRGRSDRRKKPAGELRTDGQVKPPVAEKVNADSEENNGGRNKSAGPKRTGKRRKVPKKDSKVDDDKEKPKTEDNGCGNESSKTDESKVEEGKDKTKSSESKKESNSKTKSVKNKSEEERAKIESENSGVDVVPEECTDSMGDRSIASRSRKRKRRGGKSSQPSVNPKKIKKDRGETR